MKLAEALRLRGEYTTKINNLKKRIRENAKIQEGDECKDEPMANLDELMKIDFEMTKLITQINLINTEITLEYPSFIQESEFSDEIFRKGFVYEELQVEADELRPVKKTMCEALMERDSIRRRIRAYEDAISAANITGNYNYSKSEIRIISMVDPVGLQRKIDRLSGFLRIMDTRIQEMNWETEFELTLERIIENQRRRQRKRFLYFF